MIAKYRAFIIAILCVKVLLISVWLFSKNGIMITPYSTNISSLNHQLYSPRSKIRAKSSLDSYFVYTKGCVIPRRDAFDASVLKYYSKPRSIRNCHANVPLTSQDGTMLYLDNRTISYCERQNIYRKPNSDFGYLEKDKQKFTDSVNISSKYIRVTCYDKSGKESYTNYHHFIQRNESRLLELDRRLKEHITANKPAEIMNVMMVMIDSTSRLNHIRHMPKTRQFLLKNMSAVDFEGYNKIADNTLPNLVGILTGNYLNEELTIRKTQRHGPFDKFNLIWKHFSAKGYTTMFSEDFPTIATFVYLSQGFLKQPCDHSNRPLALAMNSHWLWSKCLGNKSETELLLDSTYNFVKTYRNRPYFSLTTISRLTHDYLNHLANGDDHYLDFFTRLHKENLLNNTVVVFFSDHGHRLSSIVHSEIGQFESRMPMMYLMFPAWFSEKYPAIYQNLLDNRNKFTTNFDIHKTLKDILNFKGQPRLKVDVKLRGQSLFDPISGDRSCQTANLSMHWCVCKMDEIIPRDESLVKASVEFTMREINKEIQNYTMCMPRTLRNVTSFKRMKYTNQVNLTVTVIKLSIDSNPESALFHTTLKYNEITKQFQVVDSISRTNKYKHTADCVKLKHLRNYCYCKNQTSILQ
ncbi:hypothetical protein LOTGIDRAFT_127104 [Lottia gigantea]|uniref:Sulfatase N-terminal domain-containing protein n=1 Tax=Lottia gigantea TaxID=225164 RepID=V4BH77_LOTGI|nr:hypothetical protein LOTGIDRAFT_127104 [Lottia gigantea]ESO87879.1 hypothetical protein LOTGIDRAFT_127104 [Lottia gigantea]